MKGHHISRTDFDKWQSTGFGTSFANILQFEGTNCKVRNPTNLQMGVKCPIFLRRGVCCVRDSDLRCVKLKVRRRNSDARLAFPCALL